MTENSERQRSTLTVFVPVWLAAQGLRQLPKGSPIDAKILYYGLALVGICSGLFHMFLKYHAQMCKSTPDSSFINSPICLLTRIALPADDMSMIVATSCVLHRAMTFKQDAAYTRKFTIVLLASMVIETVYHSVMDEEFVHQASWLVLLVVVAWKTRALIQQRAKTPEQKQQFSRLIAFGTGKCSRHS
jgi:dihydroceramidase